MENHPMRVTEAPKVSALHIMWLKEIQLKLQLRGINAGLYENTAIVQAKLPFYAFGSLVVAKT